jgi:hypothetical protein
MQLKTMLMNEHSESGKNAPTIRARMPRANIITHWLGIEAHTGQMIHFATRFIVAAHKITLKSTDEAVVVLLMTIHSECI